jgi:hypothetical protein
MPLTFSARESRSKHRRRARRLRYAPAMQSPAELPPTHPPPVPDGLEMVRRPVCVVGVDERPTLRYPDGAVFAVVEEWRPDATN